MRRTLEDAVIAKYQECVAEGEAEYEKKKQEVEAELGEAFTELEYYRNLVETGDAEIAAAEAQLEAMESTTQQELTNGQAQYDAAKREYDQKYQQWCQRGQVAFLTFFFHG